MKIKILGFALTAFITTTAVAQKMTYDAGKTTFGIRAGVNFQTINGNDGSGNNKFNNDIKIGFHAGVNAEAPLGSGFYLQPGILFSQKGAKFQQTRISNKDEVRLNYLEIPVNLLYKPILGTGRMLLGFGPYVGFGLGGKGIFNGAESKVKFDKSVSNFDEDVYKPFDAGANFLAGYEFANNLSFQINAQLGLTDINPIRENAMNDKTKMKNTGFGISLGKRF